MSVDNVSVCCVFKSDVNELRGCGGEASDRYEVYVVSLVVCVFVCSPPSTDRYGANLFKIIPRKCPILVTFYDAHGDTEHLFSS